MLETSSLRPIVTVHRGVEQLVARRAHNPEVAGSNPAPAIKAEEDDDFSVPSIPPILTRGSPKNVTTASPDSGSYAIC